MFGFLGGLFSKTGKKQRDKARLIRPEFGYLFDDVPDEWVSLDFEMTGLNPKTDHILSVGAVRIFRQDGVLCLDTKNALSMICRPPIMPDTDSIIIHGLRPMDVKNGVDYDTLLASLLPFIGGRALVGFCVDMDVRFINQLARPFLGVDMPNELVDVSHLDRHIRQQRQKNPDIIVPQKHLNELLNDYDIPLLPAHDALNDALMSGMLFCHLQQTHQPKEKP